MKNSILRSVILTWLFKVALCGWITYVRMKATWSEARDYCRKHHDELSSISNQEENEFFFTMREQGEYIRGWIGLYKDVDDVWKWSGGENVSYFNWSKAKENRTEDRKCVMQHRNGWRKMNCTEKLPFYCYDSGLVLVKENKTWEEAMELCRDQHTDLVSLSSESALAETIKTSREAQTDHVWTGLRYLAGNWLWVNGDSVVYQAWSHGEMPQCPTWTHRCGALSLKGKHLESWDCADKLNFVCSDNYSMS